MTKTVMQTAARSVVAWRRTTSCSAPPASGYSLPVIGPCNYRPVITAVITVITAPCFPVTCNWSFRGTVPRIPPPTWRGNRLMGAIYGKSHDEIKARRAAAQRARRQIKAAAVVQARALAAQAQPTGPMVVVAHAPASPPEPEQQQEPPAPVQGAEAETEAEVAAEAEGLVLRVAENKTGYFGVHLAKPGQRKPYQAQVTGGGKKVGLGSFATAEEAALCVARSEGRQQAATATAAAERAVEERAAVMYRAAEQALAALGKGKKRCR